MVDGARYQFPIFDSKPSFSALKVETKDTVLRASRALFDIDARSLPLWYGFQTQPRSGIFTGGLEEFSTIFDDPLLSTYHAYHNVSPDHRIDTRSDRTAFERSHAHVRYEAYQRAYQSRNSNAFLALILQIGSAGSSATRSFRNRPVYIGRDLHGRYVEYPDHQEIESQLVTLWSVLIDQSLPGVFRAIVAYVAIVGIHPLLDGNGRLSRTLFNLILFSEGLATDAYVPLKEAYNLSLGAISIQTKRALIKNDWNGISKTIAAVILMTAALSKGSIPLDMVYEQRH